MPTLDASHDFHHRTTTHKLIIKKTFLELADDINDNAASGCHSDSEVHSRSSDLSSDKSNAEEIGDLQKWHKTWSSSDKGSINSHGNGEGSRDDKSKGQMPSSANHRTWCSSSDTGSQQQDSDQNGITDQQGAGAASAPTDTTPHPLLLWPQLSDTGAPGTPQNGKIFDLPYATAIHKQLQARVDAGEGDVRDIFAKQFPDMDLRRVCPLGPDGEMLSIGSALHLVDPVGMQCKACGCHRRGKCYRQKVCLYCHFHHSRRDCRITSKSKKSKEVLDQQDTPNSFSAAKERRDRRKRCEAKYSRALQEVTNDGDFSDEAGDEEEQPGRHPRRVPGGYPKNTSSPDHGPGARPWQSGSIISL
eukprot:gnl/MRDRNA2_/MRDRNA2_96407_c0_seq1.p1 gnl/MRDRNA2_/MRDRNA2_96407_c0~~gnl/MRDRNA2_/MRDRNA2_96407_c0_seq1.p1  ORF type:complete len:360 (-),score=49.72 gnl/MRDRNA2_/MRDRNA2_96407_c0_seq1:17-1096(-)